MDKFADRAIHFGYAKRFVHLHETSLPGLNATGLANDDRLRGSMGGSSKSWVSAENEFWNDLRVYSISMIGASGASIPVDRSSNYWVTTGSEAEDRELRRLGLA